MSWTSFMDMHSGGRQKEGDYSMIYIEAPEDEAKVIFYNRFRHNPERVTCTCCGEDYAIYEGDDLDQLSGYHRNATWATPANATPDATDGTYKESNKRSLYVAPDAIPDGWVSKRLSYLKHGEGYITPEEYAERSEVLIIHADDIIDHERQGDVPEQGYVWAG